MILALPLKHLPRLSGAVVDNIYLESPGCLDSLHKQMKRSYTDDEILDGDDEYAARTMSRNGFLIFDYKC